MRNIIIKILITRYIYTFFDTVYSLILSQKYIIFFNLKLAIYNLESDLIAKTDLIRT